MLPGLSGIEGRLAVLGVETGTTDLGKMSGMSLRWDEGEGHWAAGGHCVASPGH